MKTQSRPSSLKWSRSTRETDSPSGLTTQFLLPQQRRALQQVEEERKGFSYDAMQGGVLPGQDQAAAPAPQEALQTLGDTQRRWGQSLQQTAVERLEGRWREKQRLEKGLVLGFGRGEVVSTCCLSSRRRSWRVRSLCSSLLPTCELNCWIRACENSVQKLSAGRDSDLFEKTPTTSIAARPSRQAWALSVSLWLADPRDKPPTALGKPPPTLSCTSSVKLPFAAVHATTVRSSSRPGPGQHTRALPLATFVVLMHVAVIYRSRNAPWSGDIVPPASRSSRSSLCGPDWRAAGVRSPEARTRRWPPPPHSSCPS